MKKEIFFVIYILLTFSFCDDDINSVFDFTRPPIIYLGNSFTYLKLIENNYTLGDNHTLEVKYNNSLMSLTIYGNLTKLTCEVNRFLYQEYSSMNCLCSNNNIFNISFSSTEENNLTDSRSNGYDIILRTNSHNIKFIHFATQHLLSKEAKIYGNILILSGLFISLYGIYYENLTLVFLFNISSFVFIEKCLELFSIDLDTIMFQLVLITMLIIGSFLGALFTSHHISNPLFGFHFGFIISKLLISYIFNFLLFKHIITLGSMPIINCCITLLISILFGYLWGISSNKKVKNCLNIITFTSFGSYMIVYGISLFTGGVIYDNAFYTLLSEYSDITNWDPYRKEMLFSLVLFGSIFIITFSIQLIIHRAFDSQYFCLTDGDKQIEESDCDEIEDNNQDEILYQKPKEKLVEKGRPSDSSCIRNTIRNSNENNTYEEGNTSLNPEGGE